MTVSQRVTAAIEADPAAAERRRAKRIPTVLWFGVFATNGRSARGRIRNIAPTGLLAEVELPVSVGDRVTVSIRGYGDVAGQVRWTRDTRFGLRFDRAVVVEEVFEAQYRDIRARAGVGTDPKNP